jgi:hypothetical protein
VNASFSHANSVFHILLGAQGMTSLVSWQRLFLAANRIFKLMSFSAVTEEVRECVLAMPTSTIGVLTRRRAAPPARPFGSGP